MSSSNDTELELILIYNTGGTFSCKEDANGKLDPENGAVLEWLKCSDSFKQLTNTMPSKLHFAYKESEPFIDSAKATHETWNTIVNDIANFIKGEGLKDMKVLSASGSEVTDPNNCKAKGCIIIHGTDTLAYTASAVSFGLQNTGIPIVITGSQYPVGELNSDAPGNFFGSALAVLKFIEKEVGDIKAVCFNGKLFSATRVRKVHTTNVDAFEPVNCLPLGKIEGKNVLLRESMIESIKTKNSKKTYRKRELKINSFSGKIRLFKIHPLFQKNCLTSSEGLATILIAYGAGNVKESIMKKIKKDNKALYFICSECYNGLCQSSYATAATGNNVISLLDMTPEAALTKVSMLLEWEDEVTIKWFLKTGIPKLVKSHLRASLFRNDKEKRKKIAEEMVEYFGLRNEVMDHTFQICSDKVKTLQEIGLFYLLNRDYMRQADVMSDSKVLNDVKFEFPTQSLSPNTTLMLELLQETAAEQIFETITNTTKINEIVAEISTILKELREKLKTLEIETMTNPIVNKITELTDRQNNNEMMSQKTTVETLRKEKDSEKMANFGEQLKKKVTKQIMEMITGFYFVEWNITKLLKIVFDKKMGKIDSALTTKVTEFFKRTITELMEENCDATMETLKPLLSKEATECYNNAKNKAKNLGIKKVIQFNMRMSMCGEIINLDSRKNLDLLVE